jgi:hypothetical protein
MSGNASSALCCAGRIDLRSIHGDAVDKFGGTLRVGCRCKHGSIVSRQHFQPTCDIGCMILARLKCQFQVGAQERSSKFCYQFFDCVSNQAHRGVSKNRSRPLQRTLRRRRSEESDQSGVDRLCGQLQPARYGNTSLRLAPRRALPQRLGLPRLHPRSAEEKRRARLSTDARQSSTQPGGCARPQRASGTDRGSRTGTCEDKGSVAEGGGIER